MYGICNKQSSIETYLPLQQLFTVTLACTISGGLVCRCSVQHPSHEFPQEQSPSGHPHFPPQHSSFGMVIKPNGTPRSLVSIAAVGYTMTLPGSSCTPMPILRFVGGGGRAAARAKNWSIIGVYLGSTGPCWLSIHVLQSPWSQLGRSVSACSEPRCSTHPGHVHSMPQVQPNPAMEVISSI